MNPALTEDAILTALRAFLLDVLPSGVEVVQGQNNRVPEPTGPDHVVMTPDRRTQMAQTTHDWNADGGTIGVNRSSALHFQLDVYGPNSADNGQVITTLFRDSYGCDFFRSYGVQPLYCDDGQQMPLVNGEEQYENRWMIRATLQANILVTVAAGFADTLEAHAVPADAA
jgi:hypothetical protein